MHRLATRPVSGSPQVVLTLAAVLLVGLGLPAGAATPDRASITPANTAEKPVTWKGGPLNGTAAGGAEQGGPEALGCIEDVTCDDFFLDVDIPPSGDPEGKSFLQISVDADPRGTGSFALLVYRPGAIDLDDDREIYAPGGAVRVRFVGPAPGTWRIRTACIACAASSYAATATAGVASTPTATLPAPGPLSFSNVRLPGSGSGEPGVAVDSEGRAFVNAPFTAGGPTMWRSADGTTFARTNAFDTTPIRSSGDTDHAVAPDDGTVYAVNWTNGFVGGPLVVYVSDDHGGTYRQAAVVAENAAKIGRPWLAASRNGVVYLLGYAHDTRVGSRGFLWRSDDHGEQFRLMGNPSLLNPESSGCTKFGRPAIDPNAHNYPNTLYLPYRTGSAQSCLANDIQGQVWLAKTTDGGVTFTNSLVDEEAGDIWGPVSADVDENGNVYVVWAGEPIGPSDDEMHVTMKTSTDGGAGWSNPVRVDQLADHPTNLHPVVATGGGHVDVAWYTSTSTSFLRDNDALWTVALARSTDATGETPHFTQSRVSEGIVHKGGYLSSPDFASGGGPGGLADFMGLDIGPDGRTSVAWTNTIYGEILTYYGQETVATRPPGARRSVTGGGAIANTLGEGRFALSAFESLKGEVSYQDLGADVDFRSTAISAVTFDDSARNVTIHGTGLDNGVAVSFTIVATDKGEPGTNDEFGITLSSGYASSGRLTRGNVQIE